jgi:sortase B
LPTPLLWGDKMKKVLYWVLGAIIVFSSYMIVKDVMDNMAIKDLNRDLQSSYYKEQEKQQDKGQPQDFQEPQEELKENIPSTDTKNTTNTSNSNNTRVMERYKDIREINSDLVGWLKLSNTVIDIPVVKTTDNAFYLKHNFRKEQNIAGAIFMDYRNEGKGNDKNTIIYGHNMKNGTMFNNLMKFKQQSFFYHNNIITFNTLHEDMEWEIFSAYVTSTDFYYIKTKFKDAEDYSNFLSLIKEKSIFPTDVKVTAEDNILTLSTCSFEFKDARFVIHAKKLVKDN